MNDQQPQKTTISNQQIVQAAAAGVAFFELKTTLIPGDMKQQLAVLEALLVGVVQGNLAVVSTQEGPVESTSEGEGKIDPAAGLKGTDDDADTDTPPA